MRRLRPAIAAFLLMLSMALTTTALSFFVEPVCDELGLGRGRFLVYYSLMTFSGAAAIPVLGSVIQKRGVRRVAVVSAVWVCVCFLLFSLSETIWMFYAAGLCMGAFGTACVSLCASVLVQQYYSAARASGILGVVMAGSGVGGMLISLILPGIIQELGWRWGFRFLAACWLILGLSAVAMLGRDTHSSEVARQTTNENGVTRARALRDPRLYLLLAVSFILSAACGIQQQLPSVLSGCGFSSGRVGALMSLFTGALALGKIGQGLLYGKAGAVRGGMVVIGLFSLSFVLLPDPGLVWFSLPMLASGMGTVTTLMPLLTRNTFGSREYPAIWSIVYSAANVGTLLAAPLFGMAYDVSGAYDPGLKASAAALLVCVGLTAICFRNE